MLKKPQTRLFNEFEQESSGLNRGYEGTGLGLTIVQRLVGLMNGHVRVDSEMGRGSAFTVRIPRRFEAASSRNEVR